MERLFFAFEVPYGTMYLGAPVSVFGVVYQEHHFELLIYSSNAQPAAYFSLFDYTSETREFRGPESNFHVF